MSAARPCTRFTSSVMKSMTSTPVTRRVNQEGPDQQDFRMRAFRNVPVLLQKACVGAPTLMGLVARLASPRTTLAPLYHRRALHDRRHQGDGRARARGGRRADSGFRPRKPDALVRRGVGAVKRPRLMGRWRQTYRTLAVPAASGMLWKSRAFLARYRKFESISLQRGVCCEPDPLDQGAELQLAGHRMPDSHSCTRLLTASAAEDLPAKKVDFVPILSGVAASH